MRAQLLQSSRSDFFCWQKSAIENLSAGAGRGETLQGPLIMKWLSMIGAWQRRGLGLVLAGLTLLGGLFSLTGCGSANNSAQTDPDSNDGPLTDTSANTAINAVAQTANDSGGDGPSVPNRLGSAAEAAAPLTAKPPVDGSQWLEEQVRKAARLRQESQYQAEAEHWDAVVKTLEAAIGPGNWIAAGARLSRQVAARLTQLTTEQLAEWKKFESLENQFLQNKNEMRELRAAGQVTPAQYVNATQEQLGILEQQAGIVRRLFGEPSHLLANLAYNQAETLVEVEQWEPALVAIERCVSLRHAVIPVRHPDTLAALKLMGHIAQQVQDVALAEDCLVKATQAAEQVWGPENLAFATYANDLGVFYYSRESAQPAGIARDFSKANYWLERGLQIRRASLGDKHLLVAISQRNCALAKMAEAATKPAERQALDLALANGLLLAARDTLEGHASPANHELIGHVTSEAATVKMLLHEYDEAESLLAQLANQWQANPQHVWLPMSPAVLFYRWGLASAKQKTPHKLVAASKLMEQAIRFGDGSTADASTVSSARQALARLQEISRDGLPTEATEPRDPNAAAVVGLPKAPSTEPRNDLPRPTGSGLPPVGSPAPTGNSPVRVVALPKVDDAK